MIARRRLLIAVGLGALSVTLPALSQSDRRVRRIGFLSMAGDRSGAIMLAAFRGGMAELRWVEGRDYVIDSRIARGDAPSGPKLADELLALRPDLLLVPSDGDVHLFADKARAIPIVFANAGDPVANRLVASLQRPGGNATGLSSLRSELGAKRLQLLKEAYPRVAHVGLLFEPDSVGSASTANSVEGAAARLEIRITRLPLRQAAEIEALFKRAAAAGVQAYVVEPGFVVAAQFPLIREKLLRSKLPAIFGDTVYAGAGGLMSYSPSLNDNFRRAATYVDKIFNGAKPGDLPVEQPTRFELVVNLKTAKAMGLTIPKAFLARADRVIE